VCHNAKFHQNRPNGFGDMAILFYFQYGCCPPSWIFKFVNFWSSIRLGGLMCIAVPNVTKVDQTVAEIFHLTIFKIVASAILDF